MSRKQRAFTIEGIAIALIWVCLVCIVPTLFNLHDSLMLMVSAVMVFGAIGWSFYFLYRLERDL